MKKLMVVAIALGIGLVFAGAGIAQDGNTAAVSGSPGARDISLTADIAPVRQVQVVPMVSGTLEELVVALGQTVDVGELLARIDPADIGLQLKQAEAALLSARANQAKVEALVKIQAQNNLKSAEASYRTAAVQLALAEATAQTEFMSNLAQAQAGLQIAKANLQKAETGARLEEVQSVEAGYQQALVNANNAEKDLQRSQDDYNRGAIPEQMLDKAQLGYDIAVAQLASAQAGLELVKKGARDEDIAMARANVAQAEASLGVLQKMEEAESWNVAIEGARTQWENARSARELAKTSWDNSLWERDIELVLSQVRSAEAAVGLAQSRLDDCTIVAPFPGIVENTFADVGSSVAPGAPLISLVDISSVKVVLHVSEENLDLVVQTQKLQIEIEDYLNVELTPEQINVSPTMDSRSRKIRVEMIIPNAEMKIRPGMFARVRLILG